MDKEQITESTPTGGSTTSRSKNPAKKFLQAATVPILVFLVIFGVALVTGLRLCAVPSGSMEPNIPTYSLCLISTRYDYDSLKVGDIIVYNRPYDHLPVVHRIIAILPDGIITKGDANPVDDGILVSETDIYGLYLGHVPGLAVLPASSGRRWALPSSWLLWFCCFCRTPVRGNSQKTVTAPRTANRSRPKKRVRPCRYLTSRYLQGLYFFLCASSSVQLFSILFLYICIIIQRKVMLLPQAQNWPRVLERQVRSRLYCYHRFWAKV